MFTKETAYKKFPRKAPTKGKTKTAGRAVVKRKRHILK